ncbi:hypothetical protein [Paenibacillus elgii]|uniref:hypothetical protein n=1 Tax=Paenibacillus elgii TaxID=189691 RepID=UPI00203ECF13|nr:hypothetical protein [Paenibacillus elgii]MCM3269116.1 hypothetical protein [Paenibacillus elgii]
MFHYAKSHLGGVSPLISLFVWILIAECIRGVGETLISGADTAWIVDEVGEQSVGHLFLEGKRLSLRASLVTAAVLLLPILAVFGRTLRKR